MKRLIFRFVLGCAMIPPGKVYVFSHGKKAEETVSTVVKKCSSLFVPVEYKERPEKVKVEEILLKGDEEFENLEFEKAVEIYRRGLTIIEENMESVEKWNVVIRTLVRAGLSYIALNKEKEAEEIFAFLLRIRPHYSPSSRLFPPKAKKAFERARSGMKFCSLDVRSFPDGATLYIDGLKSGFTPLLKRKIPCGKHVLRIKKTGYREWSGITGVTANSVETIVLKKAGVKPPIEKWWSKKEWLLTECKAGRFQRSLFVESESGRISIIYCDGDETFHRLVENEEEIIEAISGAYKEESVPIVKSWWFWTAVGLVVVGVGAGVYFGTEKNESKVLIIRW